MLLRIHITSQEQFSDRGLISLYRSCDLAGVMSIGNELCHCLYHVTKLDMLLSRRHVILQGTYPEAQVMSLGAYVI